ncbi:MULTISPECIES: hypothetical protein [Kitasatospora]
MAVGTDNAAACELSDEEAGLVSAARGPKFPGPPWVGPNGLGGCDGGRFGYSLRLVR